MVNVNNLSINFGGTNLFKDVNLKFVPGNCYGGIGANGAGKSTLLRILSGELDPYTGNISIYKIMRMTVLKQDHYAFYKFTVIDAIIQGNKTLYDIMVEKDGLYAKEDFSNEDGIRAVSYTHL